MAEYLCEADMSTGEYISRDEALKIFHQCCDNCTSSYNGVMCRACADAGAMDILIDIPAADVQPVKHGAWHKDEQGYDVYVECSECGLNLSTSNYIENEWREILNYCPNCGARMDLKDGDAE